MSTSKLGYLDTPPEPQVLMPAEAFFKGGDLFIVDELDKDSRLLQVVEELRAQDKIINVKRRATPEELKEIEEEEEAERKREAEKKRKAQRGKMMKWKY